MREPFRAALRGFEGAHPGTRVELLEMDDDVYQLPAGTYYYIVDPKNGRSKLSGFVDVLR
jgi:hypothetical protein